MGKCCHSPSFGIHCILKETASYKYVPVIDMHDRKQVAHSQLNCKSLKFCGKDQLHANLGSRSDIQISIEKSGLVFNDQITMLYSYSLYHHVIQYK